MTAALRRVAIVGLGLIGGSLALALRRAGVPVAGVEPDASARAHLAVRLGPSDRLDAAAGAALGACGVVVFAVPPAALDSAVVGALAHLAPSAVVTDVTSLKVGPLRLMHDLLPHARVVGGHPMAGRERGGAQNADADLFRGRPWAIAPAPGVDREAVALVADLATTVGALPVEVDAEAHDRAVAAVSQLPYLVSGALARAVDALADAGVPVEALVGPGLEGMLRLAGQPAWMDEVAARNALHVRQALDALDEALRLARSALDAAADGGPGGTAALMRLGALGRLARDRLLAVPVPGPDVAS